MIFVDLDPCRAEPVGDSAVFQWTPRLRLAARASFSIHPLFWCTVQGNMMMDGEMTRWMRLDFTHLWILFAGIDPSEEEFNRVMVWISRVCINLTWLALGFMCVVRPLPLAPLARCFPGIITHHLLSSPMNDSIHWVVGSISSISQSAMFCTGRICLH